MKTISSYKRGLARIRRDWLAGRYDKALAETDSLLQVWPDNPTLLVMRADLIQMQDGDGAPGLDEARAAYERAVDLDEESPAPLIELGHYLLAIEDDAKAAAACFEKAAALSKSLAKKAQRGWTEARMELQPQTNTIPPRHRDAARGPRI